jgi:hypothetical protein
MCIGVEPPGRLFIHLIHYSQVQRNGIIGMGIREKPVSEKRTY